MPVLSVIGTQWGDEGKGKILDLISERADMVVRYQGGANAGHTVVVGADRFVFHLLPSGVLHDDKQNVLAAGMVLDPQQLLAEIESLKGFGRELRDRLFVSSGAHVVFPYHKALDQAAEGASSSERKIGTTGRGIGPAYGDKAARTGIRIGELYEPDFRDRLKANLEQKNAILTAVYQGPPVAFEPMYAEALEYAEQLRPFVVDTHELILDALEEGREVFMEGAQGVLLDLDFGTYPFVTSSNSSALGIPSGTGIPPRYVNAVMGVAKAYCTRVGEGPFPTELDDENGERLRERGVEFGATTGRPRRCGWFDAVAAKYAVRTNGIDQLALTKLDTLSGFAEIQVCTAYEVDGQRIERFPTSGRTLAAARPIWHRLPGWSESIENVRAFDGLPAAAQDYVRFLETTLDVDATIISVGPGREQTIQRKPNR